MAKFDPPPSTVIPAGVAGVELELMMGIVPSKEEGNTKGTETTVLRVALLHVTDTLDELFDWNVLIVLC